MKSLLLKEYNLAINKFYIYSPFMFAAMLLIPDWIYVVAFMYLFWLTIPAVYSEYNAQNDLIFTQTLPVRKNDIVISKILAIVFNQLLYIIAAIIFAVISNIIYGPTRLFFNLNPAFFGHILVMFSIFNLIFFPKYFKTAYFFGKAAILASLVAISYAVLIEGLNIGLIAVNNVIESNNGLIQLGLLAIGMLIYLLSLFITIKKSITNFENRV